MNTNSYVDIFDTKGLEYILVLVFLVAFIFFMRALTREKTTRKGSEGTRRDEEHRQI